ncbi:hypothetical protein EV182_007164 [Spiromyces aspiralis]|uniref:Uncharacterized protein n=1 Tax=Spiromyces aspiralis TaxID=68401 RepID=A0ACC1HK69_9FUNG|nr:hypothetical protein EV182_007164 [Spiromyces aspiralis]
MANRIGRGHTPDLFERQASPGAERSLYQGFLYTRPLIVAHDSDGLEDSDSSNKALAVTSRRFVASSVLSRIFRVFYHGNGWKLTLSTVASYIVLPFITGVMAGLGEIMANELFFWMGWSGARVVHVPGRNFKSIFV